MLYSEEVNKKTKIQNLLNKQNNGFNEKNDSSLINKISPDIFVNINKYAERDLTKLNYSIFFKSMKNYFKDITDKPNIYSKKKIFKIKKN